MCFWLGGILSVLGVIGLLAGSGAAHAADAVALAAGLSLLGIIPGYARGRFVPSRPEWSAGSH